MTIGNVIIELRKEKGLSQQKLADAIGVSQSTIAQIEKNRNEATASTIRKLATFFNVSADYLLELEDDFGVKTTANIDSSPTLEEREIIKKYRELNVHGKKLVNTAIDTYLATMAENKRNTNRNC